MDEETSLSLFESGWADFHGQHTDWWLFDTQNAYRGGWMAAATRRQKGTT